MASFRDQGLVLRHYNLGEADRIIVLFTRAHGLLRCVAKGVRRTRSRFGARLEPFTLIDVQIYPGRNLNTITEAVTVETFNARIVADYERYTAAASVLEAVERLLGEEEQPNPQLFDLTVGVMGALSYGRRSPNKWWIRIYCEPWQKPGGLPNWINAQCVEQKDHIKRFIQLPAGWCA